MSQTLPPNAVLSCPFCGYQPVLDDPDFLYPITREKNLWGAHCTSSRGGCTASVLGDSPGDALKKWNTRVK